MSDHAMQEQDQRDRYDPAAPLEQTVETGMWPPRAESAAPLREALTKAAQYADCCYSVHEVSSPCPVTHNPFIARNELATLAAKPIDRAQHFPFRSDPAPLTVEDFEASRNRHAFWCDAQMGEPCNCPFGNPGHVTPVGGRLLICVVILAVLAAAAWRIWFRG